MAWLNHAWARQEGGRFILRFDDLAPAYAGEDTSRQRLFAEEGEGLLRQAGIVPDAVTFLSRHERSEFPRRVGGKNLWLRAASLEGWDDVGCSPALIAARVSADIADGVTHVIRGEELTPELQMYEYLNHILGGPSRTLIYLPRLRVRVGAVLTTISKTYGNLQLRDLFARESPETWVSRVQAAGLRDPRLPIARENLQTDPVVELSEIPVKI